MSHFTYEGNRTSRFSGVTQVELTCVTAEHGTKMEETSGSSDFVVLPGVFGMELVPPGGVYRPQCRVAD